METLKAAIFPEAGIRNLSYANSVDYRERKGKISASPKPNSMNVSEESSVKNRSCVS
jgi:hypothetical protein